MSAEEAPGRFDRRHTAAAPDQRQEAERDRDRILYSSAFKRLNGVTQVVGASEGTIFHNRLIHSLKVAQLGRRLAEHLCTRGDSREKVEAWGGIDVSVVEAAGLAHDLGHPPFGHVAEKALDDLVTGNSAVTPLSHNSGNHSCPGDPDGFEGNAQTFRILTHISAHSAHQDERRYRGLNLTRATLNAVLKYPWHRAADEDREHKHYKKYGAYRSEEKGLEFARAAHGETTEQSLEAAIMDYADGLAYSVHDLEDFIRAGLIPLTRLTSTSDDQEWQRFMTAWGRSLGEVATSTLEPPRKRWLRIQGVGAMSGYGICKIPKRLR